MRAIFSVSAAIVLLLLCFPLSAATFVVTKVADTSDSVCDADCSLREAIAAAVASPSNDVIVFDPAVFSTPQTIVLSGSDLVIQPSGTLVIEGPGADLLTLDGNNASRIITNTANAETTIRGIRFTGGNGASAPNSGRAGAIYNVGGNLLVERIVVEGNSATGGGGMNNAGAGTLTVVDSLFADNSASGSAGGIQNFSTSVITIIGSTFTANTSGSMVGGGAAQLNGTAVIANSTFSGNKATAGSGGAISSNGSSILVVNSSFTGNQSLDNAGGFHRAIVSTDAFLRNSLFSGNTSVNSNAPDVSATVAISSLGNNLVGVGGPTSGWVGTDRLNQNPLLEPIAQNGGPTPTHRLGPGSPAIDGGQNCVLDQSCATINLPFALTQDQRGQPRLTGSAVDIGAYESRSALIFSDRFE